MFDPYHVIPDHHLPPWIIDACRPRLAYLDAFIRNPIRNPIEAEPTTTIPVRLDLMIDGNIDDHRLDALRYLMLQQEISRHPFKVERRFWSAPDFYGNGVIMEWSAHPDKFHWNSGAHLLATFSSAVDWGMPLSSLTPQHIVRQFISDREFDRYPTIRTDPTPLMLRSEIYAIQELGREVPILADIDRWRRQDLVPYSPSDRGHLLWKHVTRVDHGMYHGNLKFAYKIGEYFRADRGMATAGPFGALRDWSHGSDTYPYVMAIWATTLATSRDGVFYCLAGTPIAAYRAEETSCQEWSLTLDAGDDVLPLIGLEKLAAAPDDPA